MKQNIIIDASKDRFLQKHQIHKKAKAIMYTKRLGAEERNMREILSLNLLTLKFIIAIENFSSQFHRRKQPIYLITSWDHLGSYFKAIRLLEKKSVNQKILLFVNVYPE